MNRLLTALTGLAAAGLVSVALGGPVQAADAPSPNAPQTPSTRSETGQLPSGTLAEQRQGAIAGGTATQNAPAGSTGNSVGSQEGSGNTGQLPQNTLMEKRQGAINGKSVPQGGASDGNKQ